jgi:singapore isolate B (sub-type 7) whole genome shotgun sequence assembly, scaffold_2
MRGPMVMSIVEQILNNTLWGDLDFLILDLPPGTGDVQLSLCQKLSLSGSVIVTTPQILSVADTEKGIRMFSKLKVPVNALVENMSSFTCKHGETYYPFGTTNLDALSTKFAIPNKFTLPIDLSLSKSDELPVVCSHPESPISDKFSMIAESVLFLLFRNLKLIADMVRRRYIPGTNYEVSFKKEDGIVLRKISPTSAEEIKMKPRDYILCLNKI